MLSWQVGRLKITRIVEMDLPVPATRPRLFAEWADQTILVIGTHFAAPTAGHVVRDRAAFRFAV
jgi:hypothetical protein